MDLIGKTALVTGSGIRLGKAISLALAQKGVNLALHFHSSADEVQEVLMEVKALGVKAKTFQSDISVQGAAVKLSKDVVSWAGHYDILINNAAIYLPGNGAKITQSALSKEFQINLFSPLLLTQQFAAQLPEGAFGKVINIADAKVYKTGSDHFAYRLTKMGIIEMTRMFAMELAPHITVNAIAPGIMMPIAGFEHINIQEVAERKIPLKRPGSPEIIAQNVLHILDQDFMTGNIIVVDGGESL
ncbi:MAG: SDR family oxidoreductase [Anaerolineaceae bacterium]|jgi:NAD(P)-dependent dehydrogenase (short-subunit alcohol dehydrogenase family)